ncbi:hypothetical protein VKT23_018347 [Stygiomarasmius scandens]|uniref:Heterokaryon incompatibility domain-containing protein n=1 Tax=Marasmiellus scandens TaxID=2682957 RepID=A0ABR1ITK1_9AGAR
MSAELLHYFTTTLPFRGTACQSEDGSGSITSELGAASQALWASVTEGCRIGESGEKLYPIASSMPLESVRAFLIAHNHDVEQMTRRTKQAPLNENRRLSELMARLFRAIDWLPTSSALPSSSGARPLRLINTNTHRLVDFPEHRDKYPPYAILSHRWLGNEVTYQEYLQPRDETRKKSGYRKILQACNQARLDGFEYIWIDTCCIDQKNKEEVAQNVKSMYAYYGNSDVCYAYLVDVTRAARISNRRHLWKQSGWFKRGWTLQELVAPREVVFFDSYWIRIGDKESLKDEIHDLTGIPSSVLEGSKPLVEIDIRERMSWCAGRRTTKPADVAYSLLGILGVQLEPDYNEDVASAFRRLQTALIEAYPKAFKTFEDTCDIHRILISNNARARLGIDTINEEVGHWGACRDQDSIWDTS